MSPLERAARAARLADQDWVPADGVTWHEQIARAVLMSVLDLPDETERRAMEILSEMGAAYYPRHIGDYHHATIQAILNDGEGE